MMEDKKFRLPLYLPAQGAAETEATIIEWCVSEGESFEKGQLLGKIDSAKSVFDFVAPCAGQLVRVLHLDGDVVSYNEPVLEIETSDADMKDWIPPAAVGDEAPAAEPALVRAPSSSNGQDIVFLGFGGYLPERVVTNGELVRRFPGVTEDYVYSVTGIRQRRWAADDEKPSDMAYAAALDALRRARIPTRDIDAIILATTTPDVAMPSTACILQDRLGLANACAFDLNAACSGWLYAVTVARALILSGTASTVLTVGVDVQSRLLDPTDQSTNFIFGDGAGAAILAAGTSGHRICHSVLGADTRGLTMVRRNEPGHFVRNGEGDVDPWVRLDGPALFRFATESFSALVRQTIDQTGWHTDEIRWVVPHQANARILKAAAKRSGVSFDRFFLNVENVGNTSSASIPLALLDVEPELAAGDRLILCSVGAGVTTGAVSVEW
jgi:3-oxoacyl-(acyl-carrier-protein) synthase III